MTRLHDILLLTTLAIVCTSGSTSHGQSRGITVSAGSHISSDSPKIPFAESFLAINPHVPKNLVAASQLVTNGEELAWVYASRDGGLTWVRGQAKGAGNNLFQGGGDPVVYFDASGTAFYGVTQNARVGFLISRSSDGGFTWESPVKLPGGPYDRPYLAFDDTGGKFEGRMYIGALTYVWDVNRGRVYSPIEIFSSSDGARSFSSGQILASSEGGEPASTMVADLLVSSGGKLVVPYITYPHSGKEGASFSGHWWTTVSEDGGSTFIPARMGPPHTGGAGFRETQSDAVPRAAIDRSSGAFKDRIYITWPDFDGRKWSVKLAHSIDLGATWSIPITVNDNTNDNDSGNPAIAVNKDGIVAVVFNDRRDDPNNLCYELRYAVSLDGGETFLPNVKASEQPTCPLDLGNWAIYAFNSFDLPVEEGLRPEIGIQALAERFANGGDTQGLVAGSDGIFHSAWINGASGVMQLWSKELEASRSVARQSPFIPPRTDLSSALSLEVSKPSIDFASHTISVEVRLLNPLPVTISGPFTVVLYDNEGSSLKDMRAVNSDNGMSGKGAAWSFRVDGDTSLRPQQISEARVLRWSFLGNPMQDPGQPALLTHFMILGQPSQAPIKPPLN